jgi:hypothetical protein
LPWRQAAAAAWAPPCGSEAERALVKDLRRLRWIKNRLQVVEALAATVPVELDPELRAWLEHRDELP